MEENQKARLGETLKSLEARVDIWRRSDWARGRGGMRDRRLEEVAGAATDEGRLGWWCGCCWEGGGGGGDIEFGRFGIGRRGEPGGEMRDLVLKHCCYLGS
ncbi:hypothetical protein ACJRO7_018100 [Eucalyptus globulus]|uniref:Uncharacterized protein n=1 Tax=Eucalyptus globulus TaxID=34317 RepID=A0ABD3KYQ4_EUCGL